MFGSKFFGQHCIDMFIALVETDTNIIFGMIIFYPILAGLKDVRHHCFHVDITFVDIYTCTLFWMGNFEPNLAGLKAIRTTLLTHGDWIVKSL